MGFFSDWNRRLRGKPTRSEERQLRDTKRRAAATQAQENRSYGRRRRRGRLSGAGLGAGGYGGNPASF